MRRADKMAGMTVLPWIDSAWLDAVHGESLRILEDIGVRVAHAGMRDRLAGGGCRVDGERVRIPADLVESTLGAVPPPPVVHATRGTAHLDLGSGRSYGFMCGSVPYVLDSESGRRRAVQADNVAAARLADALPHVGLPNGLFSAEDVPGPLTEVVEFDALVRNTGKPVNASVITEAGAKYVVEMAVAISGSPEALATRPFLTAGICPISPLHYTREICGALTVLAESGIPLQLVTLPTQGVTAPVTLAGAVALQNAEVLAGIVMAYLVRPGLPIIHVGRINAPDMRTGNTVWGSPMIGLASACCVGLARRYGLPSNVYGFGSSSKVPDAQMGYERALNALLPALCGAEILGGVGSLDNLNTAALEVMVIDDEIMSMVEFMRRAHRVDGEHLAHEAVRIAMDEMPFVGQMHTASHLRDGSIWFTRINEWRSFERWRDDGRMDVGAAARARARKILESHEVPPLPDDVSRELAAILSRAVRELPGQP